MLRSELSQRRDRRLHLLDVVDAPVAHHQVLLDLAHGARLERSFEVLGDELHELLARDLVDGQAKFAGRVAIVGRVRVVHLVESPCLSVRYTSGASR